MLTKGDARKFNHGPKCSFIYFRGRNTYKQNRTLFKKKAINDYLASQFKNVRNILESTEEF